MPPKRLVPISRHLERRMRRTRPGYKRIGPPYFGPPLTLFGQRPLKLPDTAWDPETNLVLLERRVITPEAFREPVVLATDEKLVRHLAEHPDEVFSLAPRQFEELVASLLRAGGYSVTLGRLGADGGIDVYAERAGEFGPELTLVQCKQNRRDRKIGEPIIKQLYGDVTLRNATRGLLVTTSSFTTTALKLIEDVRYRLAGKDYEQLKQWLTELRRLSREGGAAG
jgi:restriction system protein